MPALALISTEHCRRPSHGVSAAGDPMSAFTATMTSVPPSRSRALPDARAQGRPHTARHATSSTRVLNPRCFSYMASYDVASNIWPGHLTRCGCVSSWKAGEVGSGRFYWYCRHVFDTSRPELKDIL